MKGMAASVSNWVEAHVPAVLLTLTFLYAVRTAAWDILRPLWYDEIFTEQVARLGSPSAIWNALAGGIDTNPPLSYLLTGVAHRVAGAGTLATRLPETIAFWLMCLCLFAFVRHRSSALYGLAALLFPFATRASLFSYEARPYGLLLGFTALAVLCWQRAVGGRHRNLAILGIWLSMAVAMSSSYLAVLGLLPLAMGQLWRDFESRRVDLPIWLALALSPLALLAHRPLVAGTHSLTNGYWAHPSVTKFIDCYGTYIIAAAPILIVWLALFLRSRVQPTRAPQPPPRSLPAPDVVLAASFLLLPVAMLVMSLFTNAFFFRYVIAMVIGVAAGMAFLGYRVFGGSAAGGVLLCCVFAGIFGLREISAVRGLLHRKQTLVNARASIAKTRSRPLPVVIDSSQFFADLYTNSPRDSVSRIHFLASPAESLRYLGMNTDDVILRRLSRYAAFLIEDGDGFLAANREFWLYVPNEVPSWVLPKMTDDHSGITAFDATGGSGRMFLVSQAAKEAVQ